MNIVEVLKFKGPKAVDWRATEKAIADQIIKEYPDRQPSENTMYFGSILTKSKKFVKRNGVAACYEFVKKFEQEKGKANGT